jgi:hypothetical protein
MAIDDRERNFEKALGRELRAGGTSGLDCPDAETLAAYHERMLSPEEMAAQKSHIAACPHCQEVLATLEVTEAIPSGVEDSEQIAAQKTAAAPVSARIAAVREMPKRRIALRWAVPAGAIAAGLLVWIAISSNRQANMYVKTAPVQVAENRESRDAQLVAPKQQPAEMERSKAPAMADKEANRSKSELDDEFGTSVSAGAVAKEKKSVTRGYEHGPRAIQNQMQNQVQNQVQNNGLPDSRSQVQELKRFDGTLQAGAGSGQVAQNAPREELQTKKPAVPASPPAPSVVGGAAGTGAGAKPEPNKDAAIGALSQAVTVESQSSYLANEQKVDADKNAAFLKLKGQMAGLPAAVNLRDAKAGVPGFVGTPDPQVFWFFAADGIVFRTEDGGRTKKLQKTASGLKFIGGSAPDKKTCWLLAEDGKVARTSNAGKNWTILTTPSNQIFTMITGVDAKNALVTDTAARVSYATSDGGRTWKVVPQP